MFQEEQKVLIETVKAEKEVSHHQIKYDHIDSLSIPEHFGLGLGL